MRRAFEGQDERFQQIGVHLRPKLFNRSYVHGALKGGDGPEVVAPLATFAVLRRDGSLRPQRTVIPRDILSPMPRFTFMVGSVEKLDAFLTQNPAPDQDENERHDVVWKGYQEYCEQLLEAVTDGWPGSGDEYEQDERGGLLEVSADPAGPNREVVKLYDDILESGVGSALLENFAVHGERPVAPCLETPYEFADRLGHSTAAYPLADKQREVLAHLAVADVGETVAVNGPPGTGKTTMLLAVIAGEWVRAARKGGYPSVIAAASTNNQAVTNIIDAFASDFASGEGPFAGRWISQVKSFGVFLPSKAQKERAGSRGYQTEDLFAELENEEYLARAETAYVAAAEHAFPALKPITVASAVDALRERICEEANRLEAVSATLRTLKAAREQAHELLGDDFGAGIEALAGERAQCAQERARIEAFTDDWSAYMANESVLFALFSFLPPVANKRRARAADFLRTSGYDETPGRNFDIEGHEEHLRRRLASARERHKVAQAKLAKGDAAVNALNAACDEYRTAVEGLCSNANADEYEDVRSIEQAADMGIRFRLFLLATHYWEGRWILATQALHPRFEEEKKKRGRKAVERRWRRRMMLTPCMVSTLFTLPRHMTGSAYEEGKGFTEHYLKGLIDLLIIDEAGQTLPEICGASLALAKKSLVIGDVQQIAPISSIPTPVDAANLVENGLLAQDHTEEDLAQVRALGIMSSAGSAMQVAQAVCKYHTEMELSRGLYLLEHRRCYDEIIEYCNVLCYKGRLVPSRPRPADGNTVLRPFAYLHVDGICTESRGSKVNILEARSIAAWLADRREALEAHYKRNLDQIVGVVTPFRRHADEIRRACGKRNIGVRGPEAMTIGTVHSLQGAERPVVLFSPVYSKHADGKFIDASPSMLNVAVSRAKDSIVVIGDMDVLSLAATGTPRRLLADFLFNDRDNAIDFDYLDRPSSNEAVSEGAHRQDLVATGGKPQILSGNEEHDRFLVELATARARKTLQIVSPWIVMSTVESSGILTALKRARNRNVDVHVYIDAELNDTKALDTPSNLQRAARTFSQMNVRLTAVRKLPSKVVIADDSLLALGSFNWLSAQRVGQYVRHETSAVYEGANVSNEIDLIISSVRKRAVPEKTQP